MSRHALRTIIIAGAALLVLAPAGARAEEQTGTSQADAPSYEIRSTARATYEGRFLRITVSGYCYAGFGTYDTCAVYWATASRTAQANRDYRPAQGSRYVRAGSFAFTLYVRTYSDDFCDEGRERFALITKIGSERLPGNRIRIARKHTSVQAIDDSSC